MNSQGNHKAVLLDEAIDLLVGNPNGVYVDGTYGRGGHSRKISSRLSVSGRLLAIDKDPQAQQTALEHFNGDNRAEFIRGSFKDIARYVAERNLTGKVSGILLDLGVSSPQLDQGERGFSFMNDGALDMRMDPDSGISAADWLAVADEKDIALVLKEYGEERFSRRIAAAIVEARQEQAIETTAQLAKIVSAANPSWERGKHPATRAFQGIRIYINRELDDLQDALAEVLDVLAIGGRLVVISFHSLEDRIVKRFIRLQAQGAPIPRGLPIMESDINRPMKAVGKAIKPSDEECEINPRARSAVMRVAEKVAEKKVESQ